MGKMRRKTHGGAQDRPSTQQNELIQASATQEGPELGWFGAAGNWLADRYNDVTSSIGNFAQSTGQAAQDFKEAISETSLSKVDDSWVLQTDLDEVMDVLDGVMGDMVTFDKSASDNEVTITMESDGSLKIATDSIALKSAQFGDYSMGSGILKGVNAHIQQKRDGFIPGVDLDKAIVNISIDEVVGSNLRYLLDKDQNIVAEEIVLNGFKSISVGEKSPFDDAAKGSFSFQVSDASLKGFSGADSAVDALSLQKMAAQYGPTGGQLTLSSAQALNLQRDGVQLGSSDIKGLQASIQQDGADSFSSNIMAQSLSVNQASGSDLGSVNKIDAQNLNINANKNNENLSTSSSADSLKISNLDSDVIDASNIDFAQAAFQTDNQGVSINANTVDAFNLDSPFIEANALFLNQPDLMLNGSNVNFNTDSISATQLDSDFVDASSLAMQDASLNINDNNININANTLNATEVDSDFVDAGSVSSSGLNVNINDSKVGVYAQGLEGSDLKSEHGNVAQLSTKDLRFSQDKNNIDGGFSTLNASNIQSEHLSADQLNIGYTSASSNTSTKEASISSEHITTSNVSSMGAGVDNLEIIGLNAQGNTQQQTGALNIDAIAAAGPTHQLGDASSVHIANIAATSDKTGHAANIGQIDISDLSSHNQSVGHISINGVSGQSNRDLSNSSGALQSMEVLSLKGSSPLSDDNIPNYNLDKINISDLKGSHTNGQQSSASLSEITLSGASIEDVGNVEHSALRNISVDHTNKGTKLNAQSFNATNISEEYLGGQAGSLDANQVNFDIKDAQNLSASAEQISSSNLKWNHLDVDSMNFDQVKAHVVEGTTQGNISSAGFSDASYADPNLGTSSVKSGAINQIGFIGNKDTIETHILSGNFNNIKSDFGENKAQAETMRFDGAEFYSSLEPNKESMDLHLRSATANNVTGSSGVFSGSAAHIEAQGNSLTASSSSQEFSSNAIDASGLSFSAQGGSQESSTDNSFDPNTVRLIETLGARVDSADIHAGFDLNPGDYKDSGVPIVVSDGTSMNANISIRDNQIVDGSSISANKSIDTPLWTSVNGAYVKNNEFKGDINGWFDMNISKEINKATGVKADKKLHSIAEYASGIANTPPSEKDGPEIVDATTFKTSGNMSLSDGLVDTGLVQANLNRSDKQDNTANFKTTPQGIVAEFARFIASSLSLNTGAAQAQTGVASMNEAEVNFEPGTGNTTGTIGSVNVEKIKGKLNNN
ncbi:MAG: hypothetical protein CMK59_07335 [Proteobacteria bacterium]|nr:hypothetical protein [Pseudomonadota bacterium]